MPHSTNPHQTDSILVELQTIFGAPNVTQERYNGQEVYTFSNAVKDEFPELDKNDLINKFSQITQIDYNAIDASDPDILMRIPTSVLNKTLSNPLIFKELQLEAAADFDTTVTLGEEKATTTDKSSPTTTDGNIILDDNPVLDWLCDKFGSENVDTLKNSKGEVFYAVTKEGADPYLNTDMHPLAVRHTIAGIFWDVRIREEAPALCPKDNRYEVLINPQNIDKDLFPKIEKEYRAQPTPFGDDEFSKEIKQTSSYLIAKDANKMHEEPPQTSFHRARILLQKFLEVPLGSFPINNKIRTADKLVNAGKTRKNLMQALDITDNNAITVIHDPSQNKMQQWRAKSNYLEFEPTAILQAIKALGGNKLSDPANPHRQELTKVMENQPTRVIRPSSIASAAPPPPGRSPQ